MAMYPQTEWRDRVTEYEDRYRETENPDGSFTHTPVEGEVLQEGTPQNEANFNNMENGIQDTTLATSIWGIGLMLFQRESDAFSKALEETVERNATTTEAALSAEELRSADLAMAGKIYDLGNRYNQYHATEHEALMDAEALGEAQEVTLTNTLKLPFNSTVRSPRTVALRQARKNLFYSVETEILEHTGPVGEITVSEKALNGFKISFSGSGTSVKLAVRIKGGMT